MKSQTGLEPKCYSFSNYSIHLELDGYSSCSTIELILSFSTIFTEDKIETETPNGVTCGVKGHISLPGYKR